MPGKTSPGPGFAQACLRAAPVYTRRLGLIVLLDYFLTPDHLDAVAETVQALTDDRYYVCMAAAWLLAELGIRDYNLALKILAGGRLNCFTQNKAIAKMRESYRFTPEQKGRPAGIQAQGGRNMKRLMAIDYGDARTGIAISTCCVRW